METKKRDTAVFAKGMGFEKQFWVFLIGCVLGVIVEVFWCLLKTGRIESRAGVIYGPFNPVYGFGALLMTLVLHRQKNNFGIFFGSMFIGATFEFACSWFQEMTLGTVSWEYSGSFMNIGGRTNLGFAIAWGFLGLFYIKSIYPIIERWIQKIPISAGKVLTALLAIFMTYNMLISSLAVARQTARHEGKTPQNAIEAYLDTQYTDDYLKKVYPNMLVPARE